MKLRVWQKALLCGFEITMKVNPDKLHLLLSDKKSHQVDICNEKLSSTWFQTFLGIKNDNKLTFEEHEGGLRKKASQKVSGKNFIFNEIWTNKAYR